MFSLEKDFLMSHVPLMGVFLTLVIEFLSHKFLRLSHESLPLSWEYLHLKFLRLSHESLPLSLEYLHLRL